MNEIALWLGTEASLLTYLRAKSYELKHPQPSADEAAVKVSVRGTDFDDEDSEYESPLIQREGSVGMVNISGSLVAEDSWLNALFGLVSYPEIARAMQELVEDDEVTTILLNINSGGGAVDGLEEASDAVKWAREFKPVQAHTSGSMMSAAYWLGATADSITTTKMADLGSIGVLMVHRSVYEALKEDGIEYTVFRAGKYKALGHPVEKLSDEAKQIFQGKADTLYGFFLEHVSSERPALTLAQKGAWAEGLTFFGEEAIGLGLADRLMSLSDRVERLDYVDKHRQDSNNNGYTTNEVSEMPKSRTVILRSEGDKAALENGASLEDLDTTVVEEDEGEPTPAAEESATTEEDEGEPTPAAEGGEPAPAADDSALVAFLKEQNKELSAEVATLTAAAEAAEAEHTAATAAVAGLRGIVEMHIQRMQLSLNAAPVDLADLPPATVVAQHAKVMDQFNTQFKVEQQTRPFESSHSEDAAPAVRLGIVPKTQQEK